MAGQPQRPNLMHLQSPGNSGDCRTSAIPFCQTKTILITFSPRKHPSPLNIHVHNSLFTDKDLSRLSGSGRIDFTGLYSSCLLSFLIMVSFFSSWWYKNTSGHVRACGQWERTFASVLFEVCKHSRPFEAFQVFEFIWVTIIWLCCRINMLSACPGMRGNTSCK